MEAWQQRRPGAPLEAGTAEARRRDTVSSTAVCHFPPGTSKWNKVEHRLFSAITQNWRGKPLVTHETVVNLIAATTTKTGLKVHSEIDPNSYPAGIKIAAADLARVNLHCHEFHGDWNYSIHPSHVPR